MREDQGRVEVVSRQPRLGRVNDLGERVKVAEARALAPELRVVGVARTIRKLLSGSCALSETHRSPRSFKLQQSMNR